ncbi:Bcr/CflA family drug resistance efflux transporter [Rhodoferax lacus]|uniref:Bcr/CflA family efflux transporter n=1 Tax=Rhodoferax lacus TaxID=2184758 RepID=A0A3E1RD42_9BURK|nr:multidrug effflux MFS transporter [Rhodoferax lacus]RFO97286.1 Bcr/CflA family drug resistance efflux transporter [Rhodoferax lacus]
MPTHFFRIALVLGLLQAIGPFAIDMYLPALPSIGSSLGASASAVQASLMAFFLSLGLGQMVYGPASDMLGRKRPLTFGLLVFAVGSVGCALAPDIDTLVVWRFVQGLGACAGMVIPRAVVRDLHTGAEAARLMALLTLVFSVSPILAPLAGSFLIEWSDWRAVFWAVTVAAALAIVLLATSLPETRTAEQRQGSTAGSALAGYWLLLRDAHFMGLVLIGGFGISAFFAYLANSSFVLIDHYGLSTRQYSYAFAANAISFIGMSQLTGRLVQRFGMARLVGGGVAGFAAAMVAALLLNISGVDGMWPMLALLFVGYGCLGLVMPSSAVLALDAHGEIAGTASALMGTLQFMTGAAVMAIVGVFVDGTARPMLAGVAGAAVLTLVITLMTLGRGQAHRPINEKIGT